MYLNELDKVLTAINESKDGLSDNQIAQLLDSKNSTPSPEKMDLADKIILQIMNKGLIYGNGDVLLYKLTIDGEIFYNKPFRLYKKQPFLYEIRIHQLKVTWQITKTIAAILNSCLVLWLTWLQVQKPVTNESTLPPKSTVQKPVQPTNTSITQDIKLNSLDSFLLFRK